MAFRLQRKTWVLATIAFLALLGLWSRTPRSRLLSIGVASMGGTWYAIGEGVAGILRSELTDFNISTVASSAGGNPILIDRGRFDLALAHAQSVYLAMQGKEPYHEDAPRIRAIAKFYSAPYHFVINRDLGIESFAELKRRRYPLRLSVNTKNSLMDMVTRDLLAYHGITYEALHSWGGQVLYQSSGEAAALVSDGLLGAFVTISPAPSAQILRLATTTPLSLLPVEPGLIDLISKKYKMEPTEISSESYRFLSAGIRSFRDSTVLIARADMDSGLVYRITDALIRHHHRFPTIHRTLKTTTPEMLEDVALLPLHDGARARYLDDAQE